MNQTISNQGSRECGSRSAVATVRLAERLIRRAERQRVKSVQDTPLTLIRSRLAAQTYEDYLRSVEGE